MTSKQYLFDDKLSPFCQVIHIENVASKNTCSNCNNLSTLSIFLSTHLINFTKTKTQACCVEISNREMKGKKMYSRECIH